MAKFVYKMQNILDIKYKLETQAKTNYSIAMAELREEESKLEALYEDIERFQNEIRKMNQEVLNIQEIKYCSESIEIKKYQVELQKKKITKAERNVELARIKLNEVMVDRKTHEKLKEKAFEAFKQELNEAESKEIDELVSFRFNNGN